MAAWTGTEPLSAWQLLELIVGFVLVFLACFVISRPYYRENRLLLGMAVASFAVGLVGVLLGLTD